MLIYGEERFSRPSTGVVIHGDQFWEQLLLLIVMKGKEKTLALPKFAQFAVVDSEEFEYAEDVAGKRNSPRVFAYIQVLFKDYRLCCGNCVQSVITAAVIGWTVLTLIFQFESAVARARPAGPAPTMTTVVSSIGG